MNIYIHVSMNTNLHTFKPLELNESHIDIFQQRSLFPLKNVPDFVINALGNFDPMSHSHHYMLWTSVDSLTWMYFEFLSYTHICVCICIYVCIYIQISIYTYLHSYNHMSSDQFKVSSHAYDSHYTWRDVCPYGRYLMCIFDMAHVTCDMAPIILRHDSCLVWHDLQ